MESQPPRGCLDIRHDFSGNPAGRYGGGQAVSRHLSKIHDVPRQCLHRLANKTYRKRARKQRHRCVKT